MAAKYRAAVIGCGGISRAHMSGYLAIPSVEVVAGADPVEATRASWGASYGVKTYSDAAEMLERERPDLVSICTWPPIHPEGVELAAAAGARGILCEKPMAVDLAGCDQMIAAAGKAGAKLVVGHQRRFNPRYVKARDVIDAGEIGRIIHVNGICAGDVLTDGTHLVDLIRYMVADSPAQWVMGQIDAQPREGQNLNMGPGYQQYTETHLRFGHHIERGGISCVQFASGARAFVETGTGARYGYQRVQVYGTEGRIEISGDMPLEGEAWLRVQTKGSGQWEYPELTPRNAFAAEIEDMIRWIEGEIPDHRGSAQSARACTEILLAWLESSRLRRRVNLPLQNTRNPLEMMVESGEVTL